ncbi:diguanylate cyclase domain-containing protein [Fusibacter sp. 3D3]|uniref:sensor domain-containing diguanylate cyclase n=1 Tax=Fusibacter sp. 3D3 TaxID=1048380 RepID=UPI000852B01B|nr:sensor domain-containing diguanylate cyclase [Fusibacter sp. 3D3]GAU76598.1 diguanylate cyclase/phosphodiesterase [Fusibacter sp. 3D3]
MTKIRWHKKSIVSRLTFFVVLIIVIQTVLLVGSLIVGGVLNQAEHNAYQAFYEKVNNRKDFVQREMKNRWTNLEPYLSPISKILSKEGISTDVIFDEVVDELIAMLRTTQVSGVYMILEPADRALDKYPSLYLRDYDPITNLQSDDDLYMICGPSDLAKRLKIPLDQTWQYNLKLTEGNGDFYFKPYLNAPLTTKASYLGYWSKPFKLSEDDLTVLTYSMPLFDVNGALKGVIGVEITLNYLTQFFPASELQPRDSLGYMIAYRDSPDGLLRPVFMEGALQKRLISGLEPLDLSIVDQDRNIFKLKTHKGSENIYASVEKIGLYQFNTPFEDEQWYLIGLMREDYLLNYVNRIKQILWMSLWTSIIVGIFGGILISYQVSRPIINLAKQVRESDKSKIMYLEPTGLLELDELSSTMEFTNKLMLASASRLSRISEMFDVPIGAFEINLNTGRVFVTDYFYSILKFEAHETERLETKESFIKLINAILEHPEPDENDVYRLMLEPVRWVKIKMIEDAELMYGVVMDVTDEIREKNLIKLDRDMDPLTKLLNRKGFQWQFEIWVQTDHSGEAALLMFDLDNLKMINDSYGHKWGDQYIIHAVERLQAITDDDHKLLGRRSGDEFVMLLYDFESKDAIRRCVTAFYEKIEQQFIEFPDGMRKTVAISAGIMWMDCPELGYDELLHYADEALYESKRQNKGRYTESRY